METEDDKLVKDDFLRGLIQKSSSDNPSDDFVGKIMEQVRQMPEISSVRKPVYVYLGSLLPFILLVLTVFLFLLSSDLPFGDYFFGKEFYTKTLLPYLTVFLESFRALVSSKFTSYAFIMMIAAGVLILIDQLLSRRTKNFSLSKGL